MLTREVLTAIPPRVEYTLTPLGVRVAEQFRALADVLEASADEVRSARADYDARD